MPIYNDLIQNSGKGLNSNKDFAYYLQINLGGTIGTHSYSNKTRFETSTYFKGKLMDVGNINKSISPEDSTYKTSGLNLILANGDLEFSKYPWNKSILNKTGILSSSYGLQDYLADGSWTADGSIFASGQSLISTILFEGLITKEERAKKTYKLSFGDFTYKIKKRIPPRIIQTTEFPNCGTAFDDSILFRRIPYIFGDFTSLPVIKPSLIDVPLKRYLIADHNIGTVVRIWADNVVIPSSEYSVTLAGTHTGTHIMAFFDIIGTSSDWFSFSGGQNGDISWKGTHYGTKNILVEAKGKVTIGGTVLENPSDILEYFLTSSNLVNLDSLYIGTSSFDLSKARLSNLNYAHIMNGEIDDDSIEFITNLSKSAMANFFFDRENKAQFKTYRPILNSELSTINQKQILEDTFSLTRDVRDLYNKVEIQYDYDPIGKKYRKVFRGTSVEQDFVTDRTFEIKSPFIYNDSVANALGKRWIRRFTNSINKVEFDVPFSVYPLDVDDYVNVTHDEPPSGTGGWNKRTIEIIDLNINNKQKIISISGYDATDVTGEGYFILGDRTIHGTKWLTSSEHDRAWGYLCTGGGTFLDGAKGKMLW